MLGISIFKIPFLTDFWNLIMRGVIWVYFLIVRSLAWVLDMLTQLFFIFAGMTPINAPKTNVETGVNEGVDIVNFFLTQDRFVNAYLLLCGVALVLIFVFTIAKIIKQDYFDRSGPRSKGPIFRNVALSFIAFICIIPVFYFIIQAAGALALVVMKAMGYSGGGIGTLVFNLSWTDEGEGFRKVALNKIGLNSDPYDKNMFNWADGHSFYAYFWDENEGWVKEVNDRAYGGVKGAMFHWWMYFFVAIALIMSLGRMILAMISRLYKLIALFIIAPAPISQIVLDDGAKFKGWKDQLIQEALKVVGCVMSFMLFILIASAVPSMDFMMFAFTEDAASAKNIIDSNGLISELNYDINMLYYESEGSFVDTTMNSLAKCLVLMAGAGAVQDIDSVVTKHISGGSSSMDLGASGKAVGAGATAAATGALAIGRKAIGGTVALAGGLVRAGVGVGTSIADAANTVSARRMEGAQNLLNGESQSPSTPTNTPSSPNTPSNNPDGGPGTDPAPEGASAPASVTNPEDGVGPGVSPTPEGDGGSGDASLPEGASIPESANAPSNNPDGGPGASPTPEGDGGSGDASLPEGASIPESANAPVEEKSDVDKAKDELNKAKDRVTAAKKKVKKAKVQDEDSMSLTKRRKEAKKELKAAEHELTKAKAQKIVAKKEFKDKLKNKKAEDRASNKNTSKFARTVKGVGTWTNAGLKMVGGFASAAGTALKTGASIAGIAAKTMVRMAGGDSLVKGMGEIGKTVSGTYSDIKDTYNKTSEKIGGRINRSKELATNKFNAAKSLNDAEKEMNEKKKAKEISTAGYDNDRDAVKVKVRTQNDIIKAERGDSYVDDDVSPETNAVVDNSVDSTEEIPVEVEVESESAGQRASAPATVSPVARQYRGNMGASIMNSSRKDAGIKIIRCHVNGEIDKDLGEAALMAFSDKKDQFYADGRTFESAVNAISDKLPVLDEQGLQDELNAISRVSDKSYYVNNGINTVDKFRQDLSDRYKAAASGYESAMSRAKESMMAYQNSKGNDVEALEVVKKSIAEAITHSTNLKNIKIDIEKGKGKK